MSNWDNIRTRRDEYWNDIRILRDVRKSLDDVVNCEGLDMLQLMYDVESIANGLRKEFDKLDEKVKLMEEK
ncbi:gp21 [Listeria phage P35]|uniref:gp21 n=1 Tax=Listeria phage P35 TaxID=330398 RepID=UPI00015C0223|nr:gp21 [Listeria phage P35]AAY53206.1 gp21 [Listeria phage P35]